MLIKNIYYYLVIGTGYACALHKRLTSEFALRAITNSLASPRRAGTLLPTGSTIIGQRSQDVKAEITVYL